MTTNAAAHRSQPHRRAAARLRQQAARRRRGAFWAIAALAVIGTVAVTVTVTGRDRSSSGADGSAAAHHSAVPPAGYQLSAETSPMGGQVLVTPGTRSGTANAGAARVDGADIAMGRVPLAYAVNPTWTLINGSDRPVAFGKPQLDIVKGCCPGQLTLRSSTLAPGAETTLQFPLQMHPGMDGDHLFRIAVPVEGSDTPLVLSVAGDFR